MDYDPYKNQSHDYIEENNLDNVPISKKIENLEIMLKQSINSLCKIKENQITKGTGFFCIIPFPDILNQLPVLMTCNHVLNESDIIEGKIIEFSMDNDKRYYKIAINSSRRIYTNFTYDVTIIEIKKEDGLNINLFLSIDNDIFKIPMEDYVKKSIYMLHYPFGMHSEYTIGLISSYKPDKFTICHQCQSDYGSSGAPIINYINNKVLGIHKGNPNKQEQKQKQKQKKQYNWNLGTFLKIPIEKFYEEFTKKKNIIGKESDKKNQIIKNNQNMSISLKNNEINIIEKSSEKSDNESFNSNNIGNNKSKNDIIKKDGVINMNLEQNKALDKEIKSNQNKLIKSNNNNELINDGKNISKLIYKSDEINLNKNINLVSYNKIDNKMPKENPKMEIDEITIIYSKFNLSSSKSNYLSFQITYKETFSENKLFGEYFVKNNKDKCKININGKEYQLSSYIDNEYNKNVEFLEIKLKGVSKITDISGIFLGCLSLTALPDFDKINTSNIINMKQMFFCCETLISLPDISIWNTSKVESMSQMFRNCLLLSSLPDISKWDISKVKDIAGMFFQCEQLNFLPDISKWDTRNVIYLDSMFRGCISLQSLPDISKWNTSKVKFMSYMFSDCKSLITLPDISIWDTSQVENMEYMFNNCSSLSCLPDISNWNINNLKNNSHIFDGCKSSLNLPQRKEDCPIF